MDVNLKVLVLLAAALVGMTLFVARHDWRPANEAGQQFESITHVLLFDFADDGNLSKEMEVGIVIPNPVGSRYTAELGLAYTHYSEYPATEDGEIACEIRVMVNGVEGHSESFTWDVRGGGPTDWPHSADYVRRSGSTHVIGPVIVPGADELRVDAVANCQKLASSAGNATIVIQLGPLTLTAS